MINTRRAKIVCTIGPASRHPAVLRRIITAGMDVARLNFSHGTRPEHATAVTAVNRAAAAAGKTVAILADLSGPKIRTGLMKGNKESILHAGRRFTLVSGRVEGDEQRVGVSDPGFHKKVGRGDRILLSDGLIELKVDSVRGRNVSCIVVNGGTLGSRKGVNLPGVQWKRPALTSKDLADLDYALKHGAGYIALSFVQSARDVKAAKSVILRAGHTTPVIAKLEKPEAIEDLDNILDAADGVMIARGDLGVEMGPEKVPVLQKKIIVRAHEHGLPVITATQMLESMTGNPRPTRAEASDVANAVFDNTDALMLSAETSTGKYPVAAVAMMDSIVREAEANYRDQAHAGIRRRTGIEETICDSACNAVEELDVKVMAIFTKSGTTARLISIFRPRSPVCAFACDRQVLARLPLLWGVTPVPIKPVRHVEELSRRAEKCLLRADMVGKGDIIAVVAGTPLGRAGRTNFLKLLKIGG